MREVAWILNIALSTLSSWNDGFDKNMKPYYIPQNRGKKSKVTVEIVRTIIQAAETCKDNAKRIRIKEFCRYLNKEYKIELSDKSVRQILIANGFMEAKARKKRPRFFRSLQQTIPNGLLGIDGSDFVVWIGDQRFVFNVELGVDIKTFCHTGFTITDSETSEAVVAVFKEHRSGYGLPIGIVSDSGSANYADPTLEYIKKHGIEFVPAGPGNPKGNGTLEGAFSQMKQALGPICIAASSAKQFAESILNAVVGLYIRMRNKLGLQSKNLTPPKNLANQLPDENQIESERQRIKEHLESKKLSEATSLKIDHVSWLVKHFGLREDPEVIDRAKRTIKGYELEAITASEKAFEKAVRRDSKRKNMSYFFGILRNIQQDTDDEAYKSYCRKRYNYHTMLKIERQQQDMLQQSQPSIAHIVSMLEKAVTKSARFVKELAMRKAQEWIDELMKSSSYAGVLKKKLLDAIGELTHLDQEQKRNIGNLVEQFIG